MTSQIEKDSYYHRTNFIFLIGLIAHLPLVVLVAVLNKTSMLVAFIASVVILSAPILLFLRDKSARETSIALAVALVSFSALLIHAANGMIEMHFHIFSSLGVIIVLAQPLASLAALLVVAVHHIAFFFLLPASLINYEAGIHILIIHAVFAVATGIPAAFISQKFRAYIVSVKDIVRDAESITQKISNSIKLIADTSVALAVSAEEESATLVQTSTTASNLTDIASRNAVASDEIRVQSESSTLKSSAAKKVVEDVSHAIQDVKTSSAAVSEAMVEISDKLTAIQNVIQSIRTKTGLINDIVFQTKLLSFNASIEAARAGDHGQGFAVVASEISKLAAISGQSSVEISQLVDESVKKVAAIIQGSQQKVAALVKDSGEKVERSIDLSAECEKLLNEIADQATKITSFSQTMSTSNKQQAEGILEISRATTNIELASQKNAQSAQTTSDVAAELKVATSELTRTILSLKIAIGDDQKSDERLRENVEQGQAFNSAS